MAKLKARGRQEIARLSIERSTPESDLTVSEKVQVALMTDGNVLKRRVVRWIPRANDYSPPTHDYGWKVAGKIKAGLTPEDFVGRYLTKGYTLESSSSTFLSRKGDTIENVSDKPVRSEAKAAREKSTKAARSSQPRANKVSAPRRDYPVHGELPGDGPGFYVTNRVIESSGQAVCNGPFSDLDLAEIAGHKRIHYLNSIKLNYLLPVEVIESESQADAEQGIGHIWWTNGVQKGPPVDPRQKAFSF